MKLTGTFQSCLWFSNDIFWAENGGFKWDIMRCHMGIEWDITYTEKLNRAWGNKKRLVIHIHLFCMDLETLCGYNNLQWRYIQHG